ncbi:MAG: hypothetical protein OEZ08_07185 [Betaproteobacteria bacterium]|nr:hypothetical protein [Betaproteobacteria bacterium]
MSDQRAVVVTDIRIPFWSMVVLLVKWALAAIPAVIILVLIWVATTAVLRSLNGGVFTWHWRPSRMM